MGTMLRELRVASRALRRDPMFSMASVVTLALGIGSITAVFSVLHGVLLAPLPYPDGEKLVRLYSANPRQGVGRGPVSGSDMWDFRAAESLAAVSPTYAYEGTLEDDEGNAIRVPGYVVSADFFEVFRVPMTAGRGFLPEEDAPGSPVEIVLSHQLWQSALGGDPSIVGQTISVEGGPVTVVGIAPPEMRYPRDAALWILPGLDWPNWSRRGRSLAVVARLAPGVSIPSARGELDLVASRLEREYPRWNTGWGVRTVPLKESIVGDLREALLVLVMAAAGLLLVACVNVANLLLARGAARTRETGLRAALGAGRWRIGATLFAEASLLGFGGAVGGVLLALGSLTLFKRLAPPQLSLVGDVTFGWQALAFAAAVTVGTTVLFGMLPSLRVSSPDLRSLLGDGGRRSTAGANRAGLRAVLVVTEVAVATSLMVGSGLLLKSFRAVSAVDPGFDTREALTFSVIPPIGLYESFEDVTLYYRELIRELSSLPGARGVAAAATLPLGTEFDFFRPLRIVDLPEPENGDEPQAYMRSVTASFFDLMGIPVLEGRGFTALDTREAAAVAIVNEAFVRRNLPDGRVLNRRVRLASTDFDPIGRVWSREVEVVGVAGDVRYGGLTEEPGPAIYFPFEQAPFRRMTVVLPARTDDPTSLLDAARERVRQVDAQVAMGGQRTLEDVIHASTTGQRFTAALLLVFGVVAVAMAVVGIYGVVSYQVTERVREMAVRMSIGATPGEVRALILRSGARIWGLGIAAGLVGAVALRRVVVSQLHGVSPTDPTIFVGVAALLGAVALAATSVPAVRSTRLEPADVLRQA